MTDDSPANLGLRTLEDISELILHSHDLRETLQNIVNMVAKRMGSDVCSIYLLIWLTVASRRFLPLF